MNPYNALSVHFLGRVMRDNKPRYLRNTNAASVFLFLISALAICIEVLIVKNFYPVYATVIEIFRTTLFISGIVLLFSSELWHRCKVYCYVQNFKENVKKYKKMKALKELTSKKRDKYTID